MQMVAEKRVLDISCTEPCVLGDLGHCGRTDRERWSHCEKRFNAGLPQLSNKGIRNTGGGQNALDLRTPDRGLPDSN